MLGSKESSYNNFKNLTFSKGGGIAQFVSHSPLNLETRVQIPVRAWLGTSNACMRGEENASYKSHIAPVRLINWCIMT